MPRTISNCVTRPTHMHMLHAGSPGLCALRKRLYWPPQAPFALAVQSGSTSTCSVSIPVRCHSRHGDDSIIICWMSSGFRCRLVHFGKGGGHDQWKGDRGFGVNLVDALALLPVGNGKTLLQHTLTLDFGLVLVDVRPCCGASSSTSSAESKSP